MRPVVLVAGLGEVGRPLYELAAESKRFEVYGFDVDPSRTVHRVEELPERVDFLHVAFPFKDVDSFLKAVEWYASRMEVRAVVVHSTVAPGTTRRLWGRLGVPVAYSPVRGKHPHLRRHLVFWPKWVAALPREREGEFVEHLKEMGLPARGCGCEPESLELAKLWETVYRAVMIAAWQELHRIARRVGADPRVVAEFVGEVHEVLGDRPVYYPGFIGGHCLIPNTRILESVHPSKLFEFVLESNELRKRELGDPEVAREVEELRRLAAKYMRLDYYGGSPP